MFCSAHSDSWQSLPTRRTFLLDTWSMTCGVTADGLAVTSIFVPVLDPSRTLLSPHSLLFFIRTNRMISIPLIWLQIPGAQRHHKSCNFFTDDLRVYYIRVMRRRWRALRQLHWGESNLILWLVIGSVQLCLLHINKKKLEKRKVRAKCSSAFFFIFIQITRQSSRLQ